jgi:predicted DCC family thiol-disulfide oxidoreductase YuxK
VSYDDFRLRTEHPPSERPVLLWDGECGFCRRSAERLAAQAGAALECGPYQELAPRFPDLPPELFGRAVHLIETDGRVHVGADAIFRASTYGPGFGVGAWCYQRVPGFAGASDLVYGWVARHRRFMSWFLRHLVGPDLLPRRYGLTRWIFLRLLGLTTLCAFLSLYVQMDGLFLSGGIVPAAHVLGSSFLDQPTLAHLSTSDAFLHALALAGILVSILLIVDVAPGPCVLLAWTLYLSLAHVGSVWLQYQWDFLLIETLFVALWLAPWRLRPRLATDRPPLLAGVWLARLLLFKLMFLSGAVKLLAIDPSWRNFTALDVHFMTQPIPTFTSTYVHALPHWILVIALLGVFAVEVVLSWFVFGPRRLRIAFALGTMIFMIAIAATGNYGFFNLLTVAIAVMALDDQALPQRWQARALPPTGRRRRRWPGVLAWGCAALVLLVSLGVGMRRLTRDWTLAESVLGPIDRLGSINAYGLFADMTTARPEVILEGSRDGRQWREYEFRWKAGAVDRRPGFTGPHMPRLDWQLWFAALYGRCEDPHNFWYGLLLIRLLEGAPAVRALLAEDPFADRPPRYLRSTRYLYEFGDDTWWIRTPIDEFCGIYELVDGQLREVTPPG